MSKHVSAKYCYEKKERLQKKLMKDIKLFLRKKKSNNIVVNVTKTSQKMKNKSLLSIEKYFIELEKTFYYNYKKVFEFRKF